MADQNNDNKNSGFTTPVKNSNCDENSQRCSSSNGSISSSMFKPNQDLFYANKVRRRLDFSDNSDDDPQHFATAICDETHRDEKRTKWNFDFENEVPLPGDWEWERIPVEIPQAKDVVSSMESNKENRNI